MRKIMKTVTLKISDGYFDSFMAFISLIPKKAVRVEVENDKQQKLDSLQKELQNAFDDIKHNNFTKTGKKIELHS